MKTLIDSDECPAMSDASVVRFAIIYEDFASGLRAKNFAEGLAEQLGRDCHLSDSFWRSDLLECPPVAAEAARVASSCDFLIVALRGDRIPLPAHRWIESQLDDAFGRDMVLIALVSAEWPEGSEEEMGRAGDGARHDLRAQCAARDIPFFCHALKEPSAGAIVDVRHGEMAGEPEVCRASWTPGWTIPENQNALTHDHAHDR